MENISYQRLEHCSIFTNVDLFLGFCESHSLFSQLSLEQKILLFEKLGTQENLLESAMEIDCHETSAIPTYQYTL